jgi:hypothetical protein
LEELRLLSNWKTSGRQEHNITRNDEIAVRVVTEAATRLANEVPQEPVLPLMLLRSLRGIDLPTASAIMTVWNPSTYGIIDIRAWEALSEAAPAWFSAKQLANGRRLPFRSADAELYLRVIRLIGDHVSLTCREIDKALWVLGGGGLSRRNPQPAQHPEPQPAATAQPEIDRTRRPTTGQSLKTLTGRDFEFSVDNDGRIVVRTQEKSRVLIRPEEVELVKREIRTRLRVKLGASRTKPIPGSLGDVLASHGGAPPILSYLIPILVRQGFCFTAPAGGSFIVVFRSTT